MTLLGFNCPVFAVSFLVGFAFGQFVVLPLLLRLYERLTRRSRVIEPWPKRHGRIL